MEHIQRHIFILRILDRVAAIKIFRCIYNNIAFNTIVGFINNLPHRIECRSESEMYKILGLLNNFVEYKTLIINTKPNSIEIPGTGDADLVPLNQ